MRVHQLVVVVFSLQVSPLLLMLFYKDLFLHYCFIRFVCLLGSFAFWEKLVAFDFGEKLVPISFLGKASPFCLFEKS
jgi:hypothetical protein